MTPEQFAAYTREHWYQPRRKSISHMESVDQTTIKFGVYVVTAYCDKYIPSHCGYLVQVRVDRYIQQLVFILRQYDGNTIEVAHIKLLILNDKETEALKKYFTYWSPEQERHDNPELSFGSGRNGIENMKGFICQE